MASEPDVTEMRYCSGCQQDKPLQQFQVNKENRDGTTWVKTRKWCHACCNALFEKQEAAAKGRAEVWQRARERQEERWRALGPLPPWCEAAALDFLVNGETYDLASMTIKVGGHTRYASRAAHVLRLWEKFQKRERAVGETLGGRGNRFIKSMAGLLKEDEAKFRQKLRRMCKHEERLLGIFDTASVTRMRRSPPKLRPV